MLRCRAPSGRAPRRALWPWVWALRPGGFTSGVDSGRFAGHGWGLSIRKFIAVLFTQVSNLEETQWLTSESWLD